MLLRLGCTFLPHRAFIVQGILEAHGIVASVWHQNVAYLFCPGFQGCAVMVDAEDEEAVREILGAAPSEEIIGHNRELPEDAVLYPGWVSCFIVAIAAQLAFVAASLILAVLSQIVSGHAMRSGVPRFESGLDFVWVLIWAPCTSLAWAGSVQALLFPLRIWNDSRWMGLIAYLWARFIFPSLVIVAAPLAVRLFAH
jgi:hypothetical protein